MVIVKTCPKINTSQPGRSLLITVSNAEYPGFPPKNIEIQSKPIIVVGTKSSKLLLHHDRFSQLFLRLVLRERHALWIWKVQYRRQVGNGIARLFNCLNFFRGKFTGVTEDGGIFEIGDTLLIWVELGARGKVLLLEARFLAAFMAVPEDEEEDCGGTLAMRKVVTVVC